MYYVDVTKNTVPAVKTQTLAFSDLFEVVLRLCTGYSTWRLPAFPQLMEISIKMTITFGGGVSINVIYYTIFSKVLCLSFCKIPSPCHIICGNPGVSSYIPLENWKPHATSTRQGRLRGFSSINPRLRGFSSINPRTKGRPHEPIIRVVHERDI